MNKNLEQFEGAIGYSFTNRQLLEQALTHPSTAKTAAERITTNQRMEFLGDRVLGLAVAAMLVETYPNEDEGDLARRHTALVRRETLARIAGEIGLAPYVRLAASEEEGGGRDNPALLADTCEAVIAAIYQDGGAECADLFIRRLWTPLMAEDLLPPKDAKTELQEFVQSKGLELPIYKEVGREGPAHDVIFTMAVTAAGSDPITAKGQSKRIAEQAVAEKLLILLKENN
ncbi:MAG: ribonuclease III [Rhodospirillaceae bacterium]|nr:ribonuclease III [Rhodospirillaceae bacterium]